MIKSIYKGNYFLSSRKKTLLLDLEWEDSKFSKLRNNYWTSKENQFKFMNELALKLNFKQIEVYLILLPSI